MASSTPPASPAVAEAFSELVSTRFSCRGFRPDPVAHVVIQAVLNTARLAPSWCNTQPWHVHVTDSQATDRLRNALRARVTSSSEMDPDLPFPRAYRGIYQQRRQDCGWQLYEAVGVAHGDRAGSAAQMLRNFDFFDAPHVAIVTTEADLGIYGAVDCGFLVNTFLLAAHSHGLAAIPQAALAGQSSFIREFLQLPRERLVLLGISFGYADPAHPANSYRTPRQPLGQLLTWVHR